MTDSHLHLQDARLGDPGPILAAVRREKIRALVVNGTHPEDWGEVARLARIAPEVIPSFGLHPWRVGDVPSDWPETLEGRLREFPEAGVGEAGLDRWIRGHDLERQKEVLQIQLELAATLRRPLSLHCLQAWGTLLECLRNADLSAGCLLHSYAGPVEMLGDFIDLGAYFSLSGYFFRDGKEKKLETFESIPPERILLESDAPDMMPPEQFVRFPLPERDGEAINHPANLVSLYEAYARWQGLATADAILRIRRSFASWFFGGERKH
ncbi:MAG: TatD family hydrolase [Verrucomicrobiaceae bacterium]|nr:TatD family hydrolase [Verrucomicrobiaceae bacterium]